MSARTTSPMVVARAEFGSQKTHHLLSRPPRAHKSRNPRPHQQRFTDPRGAGRKSDQRKTTRPNFTCDQIFSFSHGHESTPKESAHSSDEKLATATPPPCHAEGTPRQPFEYLLRQACIGRRPTTTPHFPPPRSVIIEDPEPVQYAPLCVSGALSDRFRLECMTPQERPIYCLVLNATWLIPSPHPITNQVHTVRLSVKHFFLENKSV
jgi:hypothetical protein